MPALSILPKPDCVAPIAICQRFFEAAPAQRPGEGSSGTTPGGFSSPLMRIASAFCAIATLPRVQVLRTVPLSCACAVFALAFAVVPPLAHFALTEPLSMNALAVGAIIAVR